MLLNVHFHILVLAGVYAADADGGPRFHELPQPEDADVVRVTALTAGGVLRLIERRGLQEEADRLGEENSGLAALYAAAVQGRIADGPNAGNRVGTIGGDQIDADSINAMSSPRCASFSGFSVHANTWIAARDRQRLERLVRYTARPALATERLSRLANGKVRYGLRHPWRDGTTDVVFEPADFMAKLAALVPAPRVHLTRFHGVLAPAARWRSLVVPAQWQANEDADRDPRTSVAAGEPAESQVADATQDDGPAAKPKGRNHSWAQLMMRVFAIDVLECEQCGSRLRIIAAIHPPETTKKILDCLGLPIRPPPIAAARLAATPEFE